MLPQTANSRLNNFVPHSVKNEFADRLHLQLLHDSGAMVVDGTLADVEGRTDFLVLLPSASNCTSLAHERSSGPLTYEHPFSNVLAANDQGSRDAADVKNVLLWRSA